MLSCHLTFRTAATLRNTISNDSGSMSISNSILVLGAVLLIAANFNMGVVTARKVETQNAADAASMAAGVWAARGMNAITASNHLIGEMLSMVILHEAIGGKKQERGVSADNGNNRSRHNSDENFIAPPKVLKNTDQRLTLIWKAADGFRGILKFPARKNVFELVHQRANGKTGIIAEASMLDAKMNLKYWLSRIFAGKALAGALISTGFKPLVAAGRALEAAMDPLELKVAQEYKTLNALHDVAQQLMNVKITIRDVILPEAKKFTTTVVQSTPEIMRLAAQRIGQLNGADVELFPLPGQLRLPVEIDPLALTQTLPAVSRTVAEPHRGGCGCPSEKTAVSRDQIVKVTQLARATFPWVNYHRQPLLDAMNTVLQLSDAREIYFHWTNGYSKEILDEQQQGSSEVPDSHLGLYVLRESNGPDRGYEPWTIAEYSTMAEELFSFVAMARTQPPTVVGKPLFTQEHPGGMAAFAMVMLYNGNDQQRPEHRIDLTCKRILPIRQANVGMNTLNWRPGSRQTTTGCEPRPVSSGDDEQRPFELLGIGLPAQYPAIRINWQSKLVPASASRLTRLHQAALPGPFSSLLKRMPAQFPPELATH